ETPIADVPEPHVTPPAPDDLRAVLDEHLACLPAKYRVAMVLCHLQGVPPKAAAARLGWPAGTLASRLSRARQMLAKRLARRGLAPAGGAAWLVVDEACVPTSLVASTVRAAGVDGTAAGGASAAVLALSEGVVKTMTANKLRMVAAVLLVAG